MASKEGTTFKGVKNKSVVAVSTKGGANYAGVFTGVETVGTTDRACIQAANGDMVYVSVNDVDSVQEAWSVDIG